MKGEGYAFFAWHRAKFGNTGTQFFGDLCCKTGQCLYMWQLGTR